MSCPSLVFAQLREVPLSFSSLAPLVYVGTVELSELGAGCRVLVVLRSPGREQRRHGVGAKVGKGDGRGGGNPGTVELSELGAGCGGGTVELSELGAVVVVVVVGCGGRVGPSASAG